MQCVAAVDPATAVPFGALLGVANRPGADGVRSNLGVLNPDPESADIIVFILKSTSEGNLEYSRSFDLELGPFGWIQGNLFALAGDSTCGSWEGPTDSLCQLEVCRFVY